MVPSLSNYPQPTRSQKTAQTLESFDYVLLLPATAGLVAAAFSILIGFDRRAPAAVLSGVGIVLLIAPGFVLMAGYFKHARGRLAAKWLSPLWIGTAVYNFLLLLPWLYAVAALYQQDSAEGPPFVYYLVLHGVVAAYVAVIAAALRAYKYDKLRKSYGF
ncbi:MAG: hypothetical protein JSS81_14995 [Acidobacteria bacterium]|nr:hypothetical protein [Acidobacteriota bacterium]